MNVLDLLQADKHLLKKVSTTHGGEYAGPCPWCGGRDRFRVWPERKEGGCYWCRGCGKRGDNIQYLREFRSMGYRSACEYLAIAPKSYGAYSVLPPVRRQRQGFVPRPMGTLNDVWSRQAGIFLERCRRDLWSDRGAETLAFLHDKGLSDWNIKAAALGLNLSDHHADCGSWGLPLETQSNGRPKQIWIPSGLVIPYRQDDQVIRLRIRRPNPGDGPRYVIVAGSDMRPMRLSMCNRHAVVVESELDGLLISQEAADLAAVVALGSVTTKPDSAAHQLLENSETILVSLDCDEAGAKAAWGFWPSAYGDKVKRWPCTMGKDPSEAWQNGLDIRCWIQAGISHS